MDTLTAARAQMVVSLGFHMIFAALGIGMPLMLLIAEALWLKTGRLHYRELARQWAKATALTFAVGAVSGTALSFGTMPLLRQHADPSTDVGGFDDINLGAIWLGQLTVGSNGSLPAGDVTFGTRTDDGSTVLPALFTILVWVSLFCLA